MGTLLVAFIYLSRILLIIFRMLWIFLAPILIVITIVVVWKIYQGKVEKKRYYDYCKTHGISPADDDKNFSDMTRENIYRERDSWL